jgi:hypothetical protein
MTPFKHVTHVIHYAGFLPWEHSPVPRIMEMQLINRIKTKTVMPEINKKEILNDTMELSHLF